jgi:uncharacterized repeat protein (TIGR03803 family)
VLQNFALGSGPLSGLIFDRNGNLYGTGGAGGLGEVFELIPGAGGWTEKVLYSFQGGADGFYPKGGLLPDGGNLYGTTEYGGANGYGTVYELIRGTGENWTKQILYNFSNNGMDGAYPAASLTADSSGNLYSTTSSGTTNSHGGTVFELTRSGGGSWAELVLHEFVDNGSDGFAPLGAVVFDRSGNLYGTTDWGGTNGVGTVFELTPNGDGTWAETILHDFDNNGSDGFYPYAGVIRDAHGNLYGTTFEGGVDSGGTVFEVKP